MPLDEEPLDSATNWVAEHTRRYVETDGEDGHFWRGIPTLVLTTMGRRSGRPRRNALIYGRDGGNYVVVASKGGADIHPLWYLNLTAEPEVRLQVGADKLRAHAHTASAEEKARLWPVMAGIFPNYDDYKAKTSRDIPVVVLEPAA
ncbi:MAG: nitroreductase family deazaflavin-dependent oxidoreductase [Chloroflexota bacterium]